MRADRAAFVVAGWLATLAALPAAAHPYMPAYLQLRESEAGIYEVFFKLPAFGRLAPPIFVQLPERCRELTGRETRADTGAHASRWTIRCAGGLAGASIGLEGLELVPTDALVRVEHANGSTEVVRLTPDEPAFVVEPLATFGRVAASYFVIGVEHILLGIDHLLFVLALLLVVRGVWALVKTVTAFTVAHSITLGLATLGVVHVPSAPVEAVIALSIVFVAAEIVRMHRGRPGLTARAPWLVAFVFGLLHGLGFAGALSEVGLPETHLPLALLAFNLGVEAGQLAFIAGVLALTALWRRLDVSVPRWAPLVPAYAIGVVAMMWVIERIGSFVA